MALIHKRVRRLKPPFPLPQLKILLDQVDEAVGDFDECILLRPDSALAQAQKCFALVSGGDKVRIPNDARPSTDAKFSAFCLVQYRQAYTGHNASQVQSAMDGFEDVIRRFPTCAEGYALYAQVQKRKYLSPLRPLYNLQDLSTTMSCV